MQYKLVNENFKSDYGKNLLRARGITNINDFLKPTSICLQSPEFLDNILKGTEVLIKTLKENKPILIIVDSDVDGYTSAAITYQYIMTAFSYLNPNVQYKLHNGKQHGLEDHIEELINEDWGLIICPDSSSNDKEYHEKLNCPVLVLDHHELDRDTAPNAIR